MEALPAFRDDPRPGPCTVLVYFHVRGPKVFDPGETKEFYVPGIDLGYGVLIYLTDGRAMMVPPQQRSFAKATKFPRSVP